MDWSRIKTIFIVAFLILDLFLLSQLKAKTEFETKEDPTVEENLKTDGIDYSNLPSDHIKDQYLSANTKVFEETVLDTLTDQDAYLLESNTVIYSNLQKPISIGEDGDLTKLLQFVKTNVLFGDQYDLWEYNGEAKIVTFYQKVDDKFLFLNQSGQLVFTLNIDNQVVSYKQTMLDSFDPISDKEEVLSAFRGVESLYRKGMIKSESKIVKAELGYYTLVNMEATQVLTPTWRIIVEKDGIRENLLFNAIEGQIIVVPRGNEKNWSE
ncbi:MAG TPA: two-component system regulatory protein YycI [Bacillaceae bacterium]|nr:two-component system regulatory protein YycI [Paenibacillus bovis]HLU23663.1 two-component system regulatory protein YycI [Bacillaceae bacterium]